jgi:hypothetical protein
VGVSPYTITAPSKTLDVAFLSPVLLVKSAPEEDCKTFMDCERTVAEWCDVFATAGCKEARDTGKKLLHPGRAAALAKTPIKLTLEEVRTNPEMLKLESLTMDRPTVGSDDGRLGARRRHL